MGQTTSHFAEDYYVEERIVTGKGACLTHLEVLNHDYSWTISNFTMYKDPIQSSVFCTGGKDELQWKLQFVPSEIRCPVIFIVLVSSPKPRVVVDITLWAVQSNGSKYCIQSRTGIFQDATDTNKNKPFTRFPPKATTLPIRPLPDDKLTILCQISIFDKIVNVSQVSTNVHGNMPNCRMPDDLKHFFETKKLCDIVFNVGEKVVGAHKAILAARSPVFLAMFDSEMLENKSSRVIIDDIEFDVFEEMLRFIYTGEAPNLNNLATGLLAAAEKYDLQRLKALSEAALCETLEITNVAEILVLADLYGARYLKRLAMDFINMHTDDVTKTSGFQRMANSHPLLMMETVNAVAKNRKIMISSDKERGILRRVLSIPFMFIVFLVKTLLAAMDRKITIGSNKGKGIVRCVLSIPFLSINLVTLCCIGLVTGLIFHTIYKYDYFQLHEPVPCPQCPDRCHYWNLIQDLAIWIFRNMNIFRFTWALLGLERLFCTFPTIFNLSFQQLINELSTIYTLFGVLIVLSCKLKMGLCIYLTDRL